MALKVKLNNVLSDQNMTIDDLAKKCGISNIDLSTLQILKFIDPRFLMLEKICKELDCNLGDIICFDKEENVKCNQNMVV
ncbi:helix-turn-helix domain-containing protein [Bacteroidota bacterium]